MQNFKIEFKNNLDTNLFDKNFYALLFEAILKQKFKK